MQRDNRVEVDLSTDRSARAGRAAENTRNVPYKSFTVTELTAGAVIEIAAGQGAPFFTYAAGDGWEVDNPCDAVTDGLFIRNAAQPGSSAVIQLGIASQFIGAQ